MNRRALLPWALTILSATCGAIGVVLIPSWDSAAWLALSLVFDVVDGMAARRWQGETESGAWLDWTVDTALSYAIVFRLAADFPVHAVSAMGVLIGVQTYAKATGRRFSGRALVTAVALVIMAIVSS